jgi:hypothetical protein
VKTIRETFLYVLLFPYALGFLGAASNQLVIIANHGKFPVMMNPVWTSQQSPDSDGMIDTVHCVMTPETQLNFLADIFNLGDSIESVGDLLIHAGESLENYCFGLWIGIILFRKQDG